MLVNLLTWTYVTNVSYRSIVDYDRDLPKNKFIVSDANLLGYT